jgi:hypothetical protein
MCALLCVPSGHPVLSGQDTADDVQVSFVAACGAWLHLSVPTCLSKTQPFTLPPPCCHTLPRRIAAAIAEAGLSGRAHPTDYLQFFCLGKREAAGSAAAHHVSQRERSLHPC